MPSLSRPLLKHVYFSALLGHQSRLALGQDENAGDHLYAFGESGDVGHEGQGFMGYALMGVGEIVDVRVELRVGAKDVVQDAHVAVAQVFGGLCEGPHGSHVMPDFHGGE